MKKFFLLPFLIAFSFPSITMAAGNTFDPATNTLTMESVTVTGDRVYSNVVIRIDQFTVLGVGSSTPPPDNTQVSATCSESNFTIDKFNAIQVGMTIDQVNQIIGCEPFTVLRDPRGEAHNWRHISSSKSIIVIFEQPSLTVTGQMGSQFKTGTGF